MSGRPSDREMTARRAGTYGPALAAPSFWRWLDALSAEERAECLRRLLASKAVAGFRARREARRRTRPVFALAALPHVRACKKATRAVGAVKQRGAA